MPDIETTCQSLLAPVPLLSVISRFVVEVRRERRNSSLLYALSFPDDETKTKLSDRVTGLMVALVVSADCVAVPRCTATPAANSATVQRTVTEPVEDPLVNRSVEPFRIVPRTIDCEGELALNRSVNQRIVRELSVNAGVNVTSCDEAVNVTSPVRTVSIVAEYDTAVSMPTRHTTANAVKVQSREVFMSCIGRAVRSTVRFAMITANLWVGGHSAMVSSWADRSLLQ